MSIAGSETPIEDLPYEDDVSHNPYVLKSWLRYLQWKQFAEPQVRNALHERAVAVLPRSYKLWYQYLEELLQQAKIYSPDHPFFETVNDAFERALELLNKMPRLWLMYVDFLGQQPFVTRTRRTFDRALRSLPVTQHQRIWDAYLNWIRRINCTETAVRVYRRYLLLRPDEAEDFVEFLLSVDRPEEAAVRLEALLNDHHFESTRGKSRMQLWLWLCDILSHHPACGKYLKVDAIVRHGIAQFSDQVGRLWTALASYYIRLGNYDKARDVYEEALSAVMTVRDFTHVWDAYTKFEDTVLAGFVDDKSADQRDFDLLMARYENLIDRRPLLLSSVLLRQNPHNVNEWHKRVKLYSNPRLVVDTYTKALQTVDPFKATGRPHTLWVNFAKYYETCNDSKSARQVFETATKAKLKTVDDLAIVWCEYVEFELRQREFETARALLKRATQVPADRRVKNDQPVQQRLFKSTRLWSLYADIEESLGTFDTTRAVYEKMIELKIVTPQLIINYAHFLEEHKFYEESFKVYEKGVSIFSFPYSLDIWICYLTKFVSRYGEKKIERARDLFDQAIEKAPGDLAKVLFIMYADLEEKYGLARHAMSIYERATQAVADEDKFMMYNLYISRAAEIFGVTRTREIYEKAIAGLPDTVVKDMCVQYAMLERKLGEIDRARAIYVHASQYSDPRIDGGFWEVWKNFEIRHGNEDTFREMLRIKRSVQNQYAMHTGFVSGGQMQIGAAPTAGVDAGAAAGIKRGRPDEMAALEQSTASARPTLAAAQAQAASEEPTSKRARIDNPDKIELEDEEAAPAIELEQLSVPQAVFGSAKQIDEATIVETASQAAAKREATQAAAANIGARERFRRHK